MEKDPIIEVVGLTKVFKEDTIISDLNYTFYGGKIYGLVGSNGSGKTVFMKILSGFLKPTSGVVKYGSQLLYKDIEFPQSIGILIENPAMLDYLSGFNNLKLLANISKKANQTDIIQLMEMFDLDPKSKKTVEKYSLGMKQKLGLIQALMEMPNVIILDEPTNSLDKQSIYVFINYLRSLKDEGRVIIISSHHNNDLNSLCDEIIHFPYIGDAHEVS